MTNPGRNDPCPCGSGKKFKRCCALKSSPEKSSADFDITAAFRMALRYHQIGRSAEAELLYRKILAKAPYHADALHNLGVMAFSSGQYGVAQELIQRAIKINPENAIFFHTLGKTLQRQDKVQHALASFKKAIELQPQFAEAYLNFGNALNELGQIAHAVASYRRGLEIAPQNNDIESNLLHVLNYAPDISLKEVFEAHLTFGKRYTPAGVEAHLNDRNPDRPLKIGYVSADLRNHAVAFFIEPVLKHSDRSQFDVICYSNYSKPDQVTQRLQTLPHTWRDVARLSDEQLARRIREDRIDILVDLSGHTAGNRLRVFAMKPAPIQITWLGYFNTTGLPGMDYLISDAVSSPPQDPQQFTETLIRMPHARLCYLPPTYAPPVSAAPASTQQTITFGCFNKLTKLNQGVIAAWSKILNAVPSSKLVLKAAPLQDDTVQQHYRTQFAAQGISEERISCRPRTAHAEMLTEYGEIDIALDPFPFNGGLTTCEALWQGVPTLTLRGESIIGRQSASILTTVGLEDWIADSVDSYVAKAVLAARDITELTNLRSQLRARVTASPLCDADKFTRGLEQSYRDVWRKWCS